MLLVVTLALADNSGGFVGIAVESLQKVTTT